VSIVNFATGLLEVHNDSTHLTVGPSHGLTARHWPVRTRSVPKRVVPSPVRPSCVVQARAEALPRRRSSLNSGLHLRTLRYRQNSFPPAEQEPVRCISQSLTKPRTGRPAHQVRTRSGPKEGRTGVAGAALLNALASRAVRASAVVVHCTRLTVKSAGRQQSGTPKLRRAELDIYLQARGAHLRAARRVEHHDASSASMAFAALMSSVSKPSVNQ
jgi:hypothetical protein